MLAYCLCVCVCERDRLREAPFKAALKHRCVPKTKRPPLSSRSHVCQNVAPLEVVIPSPGFLAVSSRVMNPLPFTSARSGSRQKRGGGAVGEGRGGRRNIIRHEKGSWKRRHLPLSDSLSLPPVIRHVSLSGGSAPN